MKRIVIILLISLMGCSRENSNNIITIDANENYPELDLKLSDIADISYIPLKLGKDSIFIKGSMPRSVFVTSDRIFVGDPNITDPKIVVYNHNGEPLFRIGEKGNGPGELISGHFCFVADTIRKEVFIWGTMENQLYVFSLEGLYKRSKNDYGSKISFNNLENLNNKTLFGFNPKAIYYQPEWIAKGNKIINRGRRSLSFFDKDSLTLIDVPDINFSRAHIGKTGTSMMSITKTFNGSYFFTLRSDTTFFLNDSLKITPRFVDITKYENKGERSIFPVLETNRYIFLTTAMALSVDSDFNSIKFLVYDKTKRKIFKIKSELPKKESDDPVAHYAEHINIVAFDQTLNPNYIARYLYYGTLKNNYDRLSDTLKRIAGQMNENDNPVLMLIKFK